MKRHLLLIILLVVIPTISYAQYDAKYLAGGVPEVGGKVVFTKTVEFANQTKQQTYDLAYAFAEQFCKTNNQSRLSYSDPDKGDVAIAVSKYLVFQDKALSLDRALMTCNIVIHCESEKIMVTISNIRYLYALSNEPTPTKYLAEDMITDKKTLSGRNTMTKASAKFRNATIDFAHDVFSQISKQSTVSNSVAIETATITAPAIVREGFVKMELDKVPQTILKMLPGSEMVVAPQKNSKQSEARAQWKGFGYMAGKNTASIAIDPDSKTYKAIGNNEDYDILFSNDGKVWFVIKCRKQGESFDGQQKVIVGEVLSIEVK